MRIIPATLAVFVLACSSTTLTYAANIGFHKTLTAGGPVLLKICSNSGLIHVAGVAGNTVQITATIHKSDWHEMGDGGQMKQIAAAPPVLQTGNTIKIGNATTCGSNVLRGIDIDYEISAPKNASVFAHNGAGAIHVESIGGYVRASTGKGDIMVNGIGAESMLSTGSGNLDIQGAHGMLLARTGSGNMTIENSDISQSQFRVGTGNITGTGLKGGLKASTGNGSISLEGVPTSDWSMRTGTGTIHFGADANAKFELDAETGMGTIDSTLPAPLSGHMTDGVLRGPVRGGGPVVKMYTGSGNITLQ